MSYDSLTLKGEYTERQYVRQCDNALKAGSELLTSNESIHEWRNAVICVTEMFRRFDPPL